LVGFVEEAERQAKESSRLLCVYRTPRAARVKRQVGLPSGIVLPGFPAAHLGDRTPVPLRIFVSEVFLRPSLTTRSGWLTINNKKKEVQAMT